MRWKRNYTLIERSQQDEAKLDEVEAKLYLDREG
jgi:hypothetical protein